jgi:chromosome segregation ATPase
MSWLQLQEAPKATSPQSNERDSGATLAAQALKQQVSALEGQQREAHTRAAELEASLAASHGALEQKQRKKQGWKRDAQSAAAQRADGERELAQYRHFAERCVRRMERLQEGLLGSAGTEEGDGAELAAEVHGGGPAEAVSGLEAALAEAGKEQEACTAALDACTRVRTSPERKLALAHVCSASLRLQRMHNARSLLSPYSAVRVMRRLR